jgi:hypothetical protein
MLLGHLSMIEQDFERGFGTCKFSQNAPKIRGMVEVNYFYEIYINCWVSRGFPVQNFLLYLLVTD